MTENNDPWANLADSLGAAPGGEPSQKPQSRPIKPSKPAEAEKPASKDSATEAPRTDWGGVADQLGIEGSKPAPSKPATNRASQKSEPAPRVSDAESQPRDDGFGAGLLDDGAPTPRRSSRPRSQNGERRKSAPRPRRSEDDSVQEAPRQRERSQDRSEERSQERSQTEAKSAAKREARREAKSAARTEVKTEAKGAAKTEARRETTREAKMRLTNRVNHVVAVEAAVVAVVVDGVLISVLRKKVVLKPVLKTVKIFLATVGIWTGNDMRGKGLRPQNQLQRVSHGLRRTVISGRS